MTTGCGHEDVSETDVIPQDWHLFTHDCFFYSPEARLRHLWREGGWEAYVDTESENGDDISVFNSFRLEKFVTESKCSAFSTGKKK